MISKTSRSISSFACATVVVAACSQTISPQQAAYNNALSVAQLANSINETKMSDDDIDANAACVVESASADEFAILAAPPTTRELRQQLIDAVVAISKTDTFETCLEAS